ncbi:hypothetical protein [Lysobacter sp. GCM10012299]|jgi:hypothetical protein|uniref:hypothetical protein n=1 Tax=Lysobacter sp. GCM10012299 TaxID=3317333 RepID=UPI00361C4C9D
MSDTIDIRLTSDELRYVIACGSAILLNVPADSLPAYCHFSKAQIIEFTTRMRDLLDEAECDI